MNITPKPGDLATYYNGATVISTGTIVKPVRPNSFEHWCVVFKADISGEIYTLDAEQDGIVEGVQKWKCKEYEVVRFRDTDGVLKNM